MLCITVDVDAPLAGRPQGPLGKLGPVEGGSSGWVWLQEHPGLLSRDLRRGDLGGGRCQQRSRAQQFFWRQVCFFLAVLGGGAFVTF